MDDSRLVLERLIIERGESYADLSRLLNRNPAYIQQFIKRGTPRKLDEEDRRTLARYFGVAEELLDGGGTSAMSGVEARSSPAVVAVPRLSLGASAGQGSLIEGERVRGVMAFDAHWLRRLGIRPQSISIIRVDGDSMTPTLNDGDEIMVDHKDGADRLRDGVYVLRLDGVLMVKRIALGPMRRRFSIRSDNRHYPDWVDVDPELVAIVGRVIWSGRRLL